MQESNLQNKIIAEESSNSTLGLDLVSDNDTVNPDQTTKQTPKASFRLFWNQFVALWDKLGLTENFFLRIFASYFWISGLHVLLHIDGKNRYSIIADWKSYVGNIDLLKQIILMFVPFILLSLLYYWLHNKQAKFIDSLGLVSGLMVFMASIIWRNNNYYLVIGYSLVCIPFVLYACSRLVPPRTKHNRTLHLTTGTLVFLTAGAMAAFLAITSSCHHLIFGTSTYDFGIFSQMFHSLSTDLSAITTCERDTYLSHFNVHASFIYYVLVPIYKLIPSPVTLLVAQSILAMLGIIPFYAIAKKHGYRSVSLFAICLMYIFSITLLTPCYFDFHENAFLPLLLLSFIYVLEEKKWVPAYILTALICTVKEDAPLYIMCLCCYFIAENTCILREKSIDHRAYSGSARKAVRKNFHFIIMLMISVIYFVCVSKWMQKNGDGSMMFSSRFSILSINNEEGFIGVVKNILADPAYFFSLFISEKHLLFVVQIFLPMLFLPFFTKKLYRYWLVMPFIIMNLVVGAGYGYASSIGYQYLFGPGVFLLYASLRNAEELPCPKRRNVIVAAACISILFAICSVSGNIHYYEDYHLNKERYTTRENVLKTLPEDGSVICNTWLLPHIANRDELYLLDGNDLQKNEQTGVTTLDRPERYDFYVVANTDQYYGTFFTLLREAGFRLYAQGDIVEIYVSPNYIPQN